MKVISKELAEALKLLQDFCQNYPDCGSTGDCPLYMNGKYPGTRCYIKSRTPNTYALKESTRTIYELDI